MKPQSRIDQQFDFLVVLLLCLLAILFVLVPPFNHTPLRIIFALPLLLFLPGYVLITAMFPRKGELTGIERFTLSVGLSIAIFVFDGFAVSVTEWRFTPASIVISLVDITLIFSLLAFIRRARVALDERYFFGPSVISEFIESLKVKEKPTDIEKALIAALVASIIIASGMLVFAKLTFEEERFSSVYILGEGGKAENYPSELYIVEDNPVIVGVENFEHEPVDYTLQVEMGKYLLYEKQISLDHQEKWEEKINLTPRHVGRDLKLEFSLYKDDSTNPYRSVHLWVDSVINYDNLHRVREYAFSDLPVIDNSDMESDSGWELDSNSHYFRGYYTKFHQVVENSSLQGRVVDKNTSEPISDAKVSITNRYEIEKSTSTDENGTYSFSLAPDRYWISAKRGGYDANYTTVDVEPGSNSLNIICTKSPKKPEKEKEEERYERLNMTVRELKEINQTISQHTTEEYPHAISVLKGFAVNPYTGERVPNASVKVEHELGFIQTTTTDESGYYEIKVISGKHKIEIRAEGYAQKITEYEIGSVHELDLELTPVSSKVRGYVLDENGKPLLDAHLSLETGEYSTDTKSNRTGYYEMDTIPGDGVKIKVEKSGYFDNSSRLNISAYTSEVMNMTLVNIPPPSIVEGYVSYNGEKLSGIDVKVKGVDFRGNSIEESTTTGRNGHFRLEVMPGDVYLDVLQDYMKEEISFYAESGEKATFDVQLDSDPYSSYKVIYPSKTDLKSGFWGGISQDVEAEEGLAALSFKVRDSTGRDGVTKQVLVNGTLIWESDRAGKGGWQEVVIPATFDSGTNELVFRAYAQKNSKGPLDVRWDDIEIESIEKILKEKTTRFEVLDSEGGKDYPHNLYLGQPEVFTVKVENNEQQRVNYNLEVKLGGVTHHTENIVLEDGEKWEERLRLTPSVLGDFLELEFLLYKDSELYKHKDLWMPSQLEYDEDILQQFSVPLPEIKNWDMESRSGWNYAENDANFTGRIVGKEFVSPFNSYEISTKSCKGGCYGEIYQNFTVSAPANAIISFNVKDSQSRGGYHKQVLLNDRVIWEDDVAGDEGWQHENIPVTILSQESTLKLRVYGEKTSDLPVSVWWDDVRIKPITEFGKGPARFSVLDARGGEDHPSTLYLGKPTNYTVEIENNEREEANYELVVKLNGKKLRTEDFSLEIGEKTSRKISVVPEVIGDNLKLEFILYRKGGDEIYRYFSSWVDSKIDYSDLDAVRDYELAIPPSIRNSGMEMGTSQWSFVRDGHIAWDISEEASEGDSSLRMYQDGEIREGDYASAYQEVGSSRSGAVFVIFSVKDNYNGQNSTGVMKQVLFNDEVLWEDDIAGKEGWEHLRIPVHFSGMNRLTLRVLAEQDVERSEIEVYWDEVKIKSITGVLS